MTNAALEDDRASWWMLSLVCYVTRLGIMSLVAKINASRKA